MVAIITPFNNDGSINEDKLKELIDWHIESGTDVIVPCGTTGESATMTHDEHKQVVKLTINHVNKRVPVLAGAGSNCTREAVELTQFAKDAGADGVLSITPYYNNPMPEGMFQHFKAINEVGIPIIAYNVPGRTGKNMPAETTIRLANELENVVGVKEASGDINQFMEIVANTPNDFAVLSGEDALVFPMMALGGAGSISVVANEVPNQFSRMIHACQEGNWEEARTIHYKLLPLMNHNFIETNPIPVKTALGLMGKIEPHMRLPLTPMADNTLNTLKDTLTKLNLI